MPRPFQNLQALRGVACLLVVVYHVGGWETLVWPKVYVLWPVRWVGFAGVDLFFALSGFIIATAHRADLGRPGALPRYLFRRAWRVYPPFWAALAVSVGLSAVVAGQPVFTDGWKADLPSWLLLLPRADGCKWVPVAWSLVYELMFYLAFAGLFLVPRSWAKWLVAGWAAGVLAAAAVGGSAGPFWLAMTVSPFVLEFLGGVVVAEFVARGNTGGARACLLAAAGWVVVFAGAFHTANPDELGGAIGARVLAFGPPAVLAVYALAAGERAGTVRLPGWLRPVGDASYSIYLFHPAFGVTTLFLTWGIGHNLLPHLVWLAAMFVGCVGGGWAAYWLVERPLVKWGRGFTSGSPPVVGSHSEPGRVGRRAGSGREPGRGRSPLGVPVAARVV